MLIPLLVYWLCVMLSHSRCVEWIKKWYLDTPAVRHLGIGATTAQIASRCLSLFRNYEWASKYKTIDRTLGLVSTHKLSHAQMIHSFLTKRKWYITYSFQPKNKSDTLGLAVFFLKATLRDTFYISWILTVWNKMFSYSNLHTY